MSIQGPVLIMQLPEQLNLLGARTFMQDLEPLLGSQHPRIVFDCSEVHYLDISGVKMILQCLEAARKRDGDLRLAALSSESQAVLELMGETRVLEAFATSEDAVRSFAFDRPKGVAQKASLHSFDDLPSLKQAS
jgi:anti-anti-sigma factor